MSIDRNLNHLFPPFREEVIDILKELNRWCSIHWKDATVELFEGFRTQARQKELYAQGRTWEGPIVTQKNGTTNPSNHQSCLGADIVPKVKGEWTWDAPQPFWDYAQHLCHVKGLTSGSDWKMNDQPHVEWDTKDHHVYEAAKAWKKAQGLV